MSTQNCRVDITGEYGLWYTKAMSCHKHYVWQFNSLSSLPPGKVGKGSPNFVSYCQLQLWFWGNFVCDVPYYYVQVWNLRNSNIQLPRVPLRSGYCYNNRAGWKCRCLFLSFPVSSDLGNKEVGSVRSYMTRYLLSECES